MVQATEAQDLTDLMALVILTHRLTTPRQRSQLRHRMLLQRAMARRPVRLRMRVMPHQLMPRRQVRAMVRHLRTAVMLVRSHTGPVPRPARLSTTRLE